MAISHLRSVFDAESAFASLRDSPVEIAIVAFLTDDCTLVELYQVAGGVCAVAIDPAEVAVAAVLTKGTVEPEELRPDKMVRLPAGQLMVRVVAVGLRRTPAGATATIAPLAAAAAVGTGEARETTCAATTSTGVACAHRAATSTSASPPTPARAGDVPRFPEREVRARALPLRARASGRPR